MSSSYKQVTVSRKQTIKKFVESQGHKFSAGSAFVALIEPEELSTDKTYIATVDGTTFLTGPQLRKALKAPAGNKKFTLDPAKHVKYSFFVEVKGHNKQVTAGTKVLLKTDEDDEETDDEIPDTTTIPAPAPTPAPRRGVKRTCDGVEKKTTGESSKKLATVAPATTNGTTTPSVAASVATTTGTPVAKAVGDYEDIQVSTITVVHGSPMDRPPGGGGPGGVTWGGLASQPKTSHRKNSIFVSFRPF